MEDPIPATIEVGIYRHSKSAKEYEVLGVALHTETNEQLVIYKPRYAAVFELFARPYDMFIEEVVIEGVVRPRFERLP